MPDMIQMLYAMDRFLRRLHVVMQERAPAVAPQDFGPLAGRALMTVHALEPLSMQDLAAEMARDKSQMTRQVQVLLAHGLVSRSPRPDDARVTELRLTDAGRDLVGVLRGLIAEVLEDMLRPLSEAQRAQLADLMKTLCDCDGPCAPSLHTP